MIRCVPNGVVFGGDFCEVHGSLLRIRTNLYGLNMVRPSPLEANTSHKGLCYARLSHSRCKHSTSIMYYYIDDIR